MIDYNFNMLNYFHILNNIINILSCPLFSSLLPTVEKSSFSPSSSQITSRVIHRGTSHRARFNSKVQPGFCIWPVLKESLTELQVMRYRCLVYSYRGCILHRWCFTIMGNISTSIDNNLRIYTYINTRSMYI